MQNAGFVESSSADTITYKDMIFAEVRAVFVGSDLDNRTESHRNESKLSPLTGLKLDCHRTSKRDETGIRLVNTRRLM